MNTPIQLKISLTPELQDLLKSKAGKFGVPLTQYVKHILMKDVESEGYPTFPASPWVEERVKKALSEKDKAFVVDDVHEYFKNP